MKKKLVAKTIKITSLKEQQISEMFKLFEMFYDNVAFERFRSDLLKKSRVILMLNLKKEVKGFSTLDEFDYLHEGKNFRILYSGDTIIDPEHWGTSVLTMAFLKQMLLLKMKYFSRPVWWFLISKGYKTYLLLANNFIHYYPRYDQETPKEYFDLLSGLSNRIYPGKFNQATGVIEFNEGEHEKLKATIAPITKELELKYPKIAFFNHQNPNWQRGDELACIGKVDPLLGVIHPIKLIKKNLIKRR